MVKKTKKDDVFEIHLGVLRENPWIVVTIIFALFSTYLLFSDGGNVSSDTAGKSVLDYLNAVNPTEEVNIISTETFDSYIRVVISYRGQQVPIYTTLDGKFLFTGAPIDLSDTEVKGNTQEVVEASEDDDPVLGKSNAPVTIIEFSDYQCPFCNKFWNETLPLIKENYIDTGKVKLVYRDFPLTQIHPMAQPAAEAAECVHKIGNEKLYFDYHDKLFANFQDLNDENFRTWANELGISIDDCIDNGDTTQEVLKDLSDGQSYGITGTPGFFINGIPIKGALPYEQFKQIIDAELAKVA